MNSVGVGSTRDPELWSGFEAELAAAFQTFSRTDHTATNSAIKASSSAAIVFGQLQKSLGIISRFWYQSGRFPVANQRISLRLNILQKINCPVAELSVIMSSSVNKNHGYHGINKQNIRGLISCMLSCSFAFFSEDIMVIPIL